MKNPMLVDTLAHSHSCCDVDYLLKSTIATAVKQRQRIRTVCTRPYKDQHRLSFQIFFKSQNVRESKLITGTTNRIVN